MSSGTAGPAGSSRSRTNVRRRFASFARRCHAWPTLLLTLGACGGGMVGTGTGPDEPVVHQTRSLPERIGTDLPAPLIDVPTLVESVLRAAARDDEGDGVVSEQWSTLVEQIGEVESLRLKGEESLLLIDAVLPEVSALCDEAAEPVCRIPAGTVEGRYDEALVAGLESLYARALGSAGEGTAALEELRDALRSRSGGTYRLGPVELVPADGQPYDIDLTTSIDDPLDRRRLRVRSNAARTLSELTFTSRVGEVLDRQYIGFATGLPGERFTYTRDRRVGESIARRFDVSIVADASPERRVLLDARLRESVGDVERDTAFVAQVNDRQGFVRSREYGAVGEDIRNIRLVEESFAADGALRAGRSCRARIGRQSCDDVADFTLYGDTGSQLVDNPLYFATAEFDDLTATSDAIRFEVAGLPADVLDFQVLDGDDSRPVVEREVLCTGVQLAPGDVRLYCTAPADRLSTSAVVAIDRETGAVTPVPSAGLLVR